MAIKRGGELSRDRDPATGAARSAERALDILELLSGRSDGLTLSEIAQELAIPPSSLHGILRVLATRRYLASPDVKRRYQLGAKVLELGAGYLRVSGLFTEARRVMRDLADATQETVQLAILEGSSVLYLDTIDGSHPVRMISPIGERLPAHATAAGKILLSLLSDREIEELYRHAPLEQYTWRTATSIADLLREIEEIRILGIARDTEEYAEGLNCVATAVADRAGRATAISVSVPTARMTSSHSIALARRLQSFNALTVQSSQAHTGASARGGSMRVAWSMGTMGVQAYEEMYRAAHVAALEHGIELLWTNARDDVPRQAADIDLLLALKPDVIIVHPAETVRGEGLFTQASGAGIPVLCFQRPARTNLFNAFIGADTYSVGCKQVDFVAGQLGGRGNLVVIEGDPYNDNARNIAQGVYDTVSRYPNLRVLVDQPAAHWSPEAARTIAGEALQRYHGEIHAFVVANDAMAGGVAEAILAAGLAGSIILVGADGDEASLQRIRDGVQHGTAFQNPVELAETALSFAVATVAGTEPLGTLPLRSIFHNPPGPEVRIRDVPYLFVSRDNLAILEQYWASATRSSAQKAAS
jgi:DNA-binding IclR family transcriptional regulator/ABC-type xylose transport system substrate-binding protein